MTERSFNVSAERVRVGVSDVISTPEVRVTDALMERSNNSIQYNTTG